MVHAHHHPVADVKLTDPVLFQWRAGDPAARCMMGIARRVGEPAAVCETEIDLMQN